MKMSTADCSSRVSISFILIYLFAVVVLISFYYCFCSDNTVDMVTYCSREDGNRCGAAYTKRAQSSWTRCYTRRKDEVTCKGKG